MGTDPYGFSGGSFDESYIYFVPRRNNTDYHGEVLRFDVKFPLAVPDTV